MKQDIIKNYILKYKYSYSKEQIVLQLKKSGATDKDINSVYSNITKPYSTPSDAQKEDGMSTFTIILIILGLFIIFSMIIGGALIFSFVDFSSTLPNKLDLNNNLRASVMDSFASSNDNSVYIVFTYNGGKSAQIGVNNSQIDLGTGDICKATEINNIDIDARGNLFDNKKINFLNGQTGMMKFACRNLIKDDILEGIVHIPVINLKTSLAIPSQGQIRLTINS